MALGTPLAAPAVMGEVMTTNTTLVHDVRTNKLSTELVFKWFNLAHAFDSVANLGKQNFVSKHQQSLKNESARGQVNRTITTWNFRLLACCVFGKRSSKKISFFYNSSKSSKTLDVNSQLPVSPLLRNPIHHGAPKFWLFSFVYWNNFALPLATSINSIAADSCLLYLLFLSDICHWRRLIVEIRFSNVIYYLVAFKQDSVLSATVVERYFSQDSLLNILQQQW